MNVKIITSIILAGLAVVLIIQNVVVVELRLFFWTLSMSRALLMFLILSVGIILGWLLRATYNRRKSNSHTKHDAVVAE